jgi:hypothetical protein
MTRKPTLLWRARVYFASRIVCFARLLLSLGLKAGVIERRRDAEQERVHFNIRGA